MSKSKRKNSRKVSVKTPVIQKKKQTKNHLRKLSQVVLWLAPTCLLPFISGLVFSYFTGDIEVRYIKPIGRGYEFEITNESSTDQKIEFLRVIPDKQDVVFKITESVYAELSSDGTVSLPGGNTSYMPAYEFKGMDGFVISANSSTKFKLPPLSSRSYVTPESVVMFLEYKTSSSNELVNKIERFMDFVGLGGGQKKLKYLVSENYWAPISNESVVDATKLACRDDDMFSKSSICDSYR